MLALALRMRRTLRERAGGALAAAMWNPPAWRLLHVLAGT